MARSPDARPPAERSRRNTDGRPDDALAHVGALPAFETDYWESSGG